MGGYFHAGDVKISIIHNKYFIMKQRAATVVTISIINHIISLINYLVYELQLELLKKCWKNGFSWCTHTEVWSFIFSPTYGVKPKNIMFVNIYGNKNQQILKNQRRMGVVDWVIKTDAVIPSKLLQCCRKCSWIPPPSAPSSCTLRPLRPPLPEVTLIVCDSSISLLPRIYSTFLPLYYHAMNYLDNWCLHQVMDCFFFFILWTLLLMFWETISTIEPPPPKEKTKHYSICSFSCCRNSCPLSCPKWHCVEISLTAMLILSQQWPITG